MHSTAEQIETLMQEPGAFFGTPTARAARMRGFTLPELILIIGIVGILAAVAIPRLQDQAFNARSFHDETKAALRYAQKAAVAQRRNVCVAFTANSVTLTIASSSGDAAACDTSLASPGSAGAFVVTAPGGVNFAATPNDFSYNALGRPNDDQTFQVSGADESITVEKETGYVY